MCALGSISPRESKNLSTPEGDDQHVTTNSCVMTVSMASVKVPKVGSFEKRAAPTENIGGPRN